jgi:hypothetical protein
MLRQTRIIQFSKSSRTLKYPFIQFNKENGTVKIDARHVWKLRYLYSVFMVAGGIYLTNNYLLFKNYDYYYYDTINKFNEGGHFGIFGFSMSIIRDTIWYQSVIACKSFYIGAIYPLVIPFTIIRHSIYPSIQTFPHKHIIPSYLSMFKDIKSEDFAMCIAARIPEMFCVHKVYMDYYDDKIKAMSIIVNMIGDYEMLKFFGYDENDVEKIIDDEETNLALSLYITVGYMQYELGRYYKMSEKTKRGCKIFDKFKSGEIENSSQ